MAKKFDAMGQKLHGDVMLTEADYRSTWEQGVAGAFSVPTPGDQLPEWTDLSDLASTSFGGKILFATDEWFSGCDTLINPAAPVWVEGKFTPYGKWMDGWESRRKRIPGNDYCIIQLGFPGRIRGVLVDTAHFTGNQVPAFSLRGAVLEPEAVAGLAAKRLPCFSGGQCQAADEETMNLADGLNSSEWQTIIPKTPLKPGYHETRWHFIELDADSMGTGGRGWTHVRLDSFPDGGIARIRIFGEVIKPELSRAIRSADWKQPSEPIDLAAAANGGVPIACSNKHYGTPANLIAPGRAFDMGEGWETARNPNRPSVFELNADGKLKLPAEQTDWSIIRLATEGIVTGLEIDTNHFKGNCPESCTVEGLLLTNFGGMNHTVGGEAHPRMANAKTLKFLTSPIEEQKEGGPQWQTVLPRQALKPHTRHYFEAKDLASPTPYSHIKITIFPDGGISRLRVRMHRCLPY